MLNNLLKRLKSETQNQDKEIEIKSLKLSTEKMPQELRETDKIFYLSEFLTLEQEEILTQNLNNDNHQWNDLVKAQRRVKKYGGDVSEQGLINRESLPFYLEEICQFFKRFSDQTPNHVLINEYRADIGIMPHSDGPLYDPCTCVISLLSGCLLDFYEDYKGYKENQVIHSIYVEPRSLYVFSSKCYQKMLHCIRDNKYDSIYLTLGEGEEIEIIDSSVYNFRQIKVLKDLQGKNKKEKIENGEITPCKVKQYNFCIDLLRSKRISLTFRFVKQIIKLIMIIIILLSVLAIVAFQIYLRRPGKSETKERVFSYDSLGFYNGTTNPEVYIALKNLVFDVSSSESYRRGGNYHFLAGKDASVNLAKMSMDPQLSNQYKTTKLSPDEEKTLQEWVDYFNNKKYPVVGKIQ